MVDKLAEVNEFLDIKDNFLLSLAVSGKADYLVSGDSDLLIIKRIGRTKILNWTDVVKEIKARRHKKV